MSKPKLSVRGLSKTYSNGGQPLQVLSGLTFNMMPGEFVSVIGPSGCGKSTLFNIIAGVDEPTEGAISINGHIGNRLGKSGYMPQEPLLLPWKTIRENVMLGPLVQKQPLEATQTKTNILLKKFDLWEFADQYPNVFSGGMAQKAALLRTILINNDLLLMDEPFGALDAITRRSMQVWLQQVLKELHCSVLFITHDIREAILLSDKICVLSKRPGTIIKEITDIQKHHKQKLVAELEGLLMQ